MTMSIFFHRLLILIISIRIVKASDSIRRKCYNDDNSNELFKNLLTKHVLEGNGSIIVKNDAVIVDKDFIIENGATPTNPWIPDWLATEAGFNTAILSVGQSSAYVSLKSKLSNKEEKVNIILLGGSVSIGTVISTTHKTHVTTFFKHLETFLKYHEEDIDNRIQFHNLAKSGCGSNYWVDQLVEWKHIPEHPINHADLILVETEMNDVYETVSHHSRDYGIVGNPIAQETEMLAKLLLELKQKPALMWVGVSSRSRDGGISDGVVIHKSVTVPYQIPHLDIMTSILSGGKQNLIFSKLIHKCDQYGHVCAFGHRLVAFYILIFIYELMDCQGETQVPLMAVKYTNLVTCVNNNSTKYGCQVQDDGSVRDPLYITKRMADMYSNTVPVIVSFQKPHSMEHKSLSSLQQDSHKRSHYLINNVGFEEVEERNNKLGLIANSVGNKFSLRFSEFEVKKFFRVGELNIDLLGSYEHMGTVAIHVIFPTGNACIDSNTTAISENPTVIDSLWSTNVSIPFITSIKLDHTKYANNNNSCCVVTFKIVASKPERIENKIKVLCVTIY